MTKFVCLRPKTCSYLIDDSYKKAEETTKKMLNEACTWVWRLQKMLAKQKIISKSLQRFESEAHNVFTEKVNKIASSSNDDKLLRTFNGTESCPYHVNSGKVYKTEFLNAISNMECNI